MKRKRISKALTALIFLMGIFHAFGDSLAGTPQAEDQYVSISSYFESDGSHIIADGNSDTFSSLFLDSLVEESEEEIPEWSSQGCFSNSEQFIRYVTVAPLQPVSSLISHFRYFPLYLLFEVFRL